MGCWNLNQTWSNQLGLLNELQHIMETEMSSAAAAKKPRMNKYALCLCCALLASMTSVLLGHDTGVMSGAIIYIQKDLKLTDVQVEILAGILSLYSILVSFAAGRTSDHIGRRYTIVIAGIFFLAGSLFMALAPNYLLLMIRCFVAGIGVGFGFMVASCYTAELSPPSCRGLLTSFSEVFINVGILLGHVSNWACSALMSYPPSSSFSGSCSCPNLHAGWCYKAALKMLTRCWKGPLTRPTKLRLGCGQISNPQWASLRTAIMMSSQSPSTTGMEPTFTRSFCSSQLGKCVTLSLSC